MNTENTSELYIKDHLGNVRLVVNGTSCSLKSYDYKAFGGISISGDVNIPTDGFRGLNKGREMTYVQMGARLYDNSTGRFLSVDPLHESFSKLTPYHYSYNSPVNFKDPSGLAPESEKEKRKKKNKLMVAESIESVVVNQTNLYDMTQVYAVSRNFALMLQNIMTAAEGNSDVQVELIHQKLQEQKEQGGTVTGSDDSSEHTGIWGMIVNFFTGGDDNGEENNKSDDKGDGVKGDSNKDGEVGEEIKEDQIPRIIGPSLLVVGEGLLGPLTEEEAQIVASVQKESENRSFLINTYGVSGVAAFGPWGLAAEVGITYPNIKPYFYIGHAMGIDLSIGVEVNEYMGNSNYGISVYDFEGKGQSHNFSYLIFDSGLGLSHNKNGIFRSYQPTNSIYYQSSFGISLGLPLGYTHQVGKTYIY